MTTDVINGVPRELLERVVRKFSARPHWDSMNQGQAIAELRKWLATAQPAADGERGAFEAGINPHCRKRNEHGDYVVPEIQDRWEGWQARAALPAKAEGVAVPAVDREFRKFTTSEGGRGYVAEWFKNVLSRYDYTRYINERLAADFACTLADALYQLAAAPVPPAAHKTGEEEREK